MKRLTILAVMLATLASCSDETQFADVRLDFAVSGNTMTKVTTSDVHNAVEVAVHNLPVRIFYGKGSSCYAGDVVSVPVGDVRVQLEYYSEGQIKDDVFFYDVPYFYADTTVTFHSYYSELIVRAHFKCAMVVVDPSETEDIVLGGESLILADYGLFKAFYVYSDTDGAKTEITVNAKTQTDFKERTLTIDPSALEWGKWYMLSPTGITFGNAEVGFDIDGFGEGGRL